MKIAAILSATILQVASQLPGQPGQFPGQPTGGAPTSTACPALQECSSDGTSNFNQISLTFVASTGKFSGTIVSNLCPAHPVTNRPQTRCISQTIPDPQYSGVGPYGAPVRGSVGYTVHGVSIYGPMEGGFGSDFGIIPCWNGLGECVGGVDVPTCEKSLVHLCGGADQLKSIFPDNCGGHASPYHYHGDIKCDYDPNTAGHSPLIGYSLDGYGIYGVNEATGTHASNLDACNGHVGVVPGDAAKGIPAGTYYHYHVSTKAPYTLGCYAAGQAAAISVDTCKSVVSTCGSGYTVVKDEFGTSSCYDTDCACFDPITGRNTNLAADCLTVESTPPTPGFITPPTPSTPFTPFTPNQPTQTNQPSSQSGVATPSNTVRPSSDSDDDDTIKFVVLGILLAVLACITLSVCAYCLFYKKDKQTEPTYVNEGVY